MTVLYTTVCNDRYANALALLLWSIKRHNPGFAHPMKVYHRGDLSAENQERLRRLYPPLFFENVVAENYQGKIPHYLALECFRETEPDNVVFIDSDILCLGDISALSTLDHPISAAWDYDLRLSVPLTLPPVISRVARLNTGVFALNRTYRSREVYDALYALVEQFPDRRIKGRPWSDQGVVNTHFKFAPKHILPFHYNARKNLFANHVFAKGDEHALRGVRLLHYGGSFKPFLGGLKKAKPDSKHHKYSRLHQVYYDHWDLMTKELGVDWKLE